MTEQPARPAQPVLAATAIPSNRIALLCALCALVAAVLLGHSVLSSQSQLSAAPAPKGWTQCIPAITRLPLAESTWIAPDSDAPAALSAMARSLRTDLNGPRVFRRAALSVPRWRAFSRWNPAYFVAAAEAGAGPAEFLVKRSATASVMFANLRAERPFVSGDDDDESEARGQVQRDGVAWPQQPRFTMPFSSQNISVRAFFSEIDSTRARAAAGPKDSKYTYFADGVSVLGELGYDLLPLEPLCPFRDVAGRCDMSVWIGQAGVTAWPHYDSSHNLFVQIKGRKRFQLAAPVAARCGMGLYPALHPFYRQAQRDILDPEWSAAVFVPTPDASSASASASTGCGCNVTVFEVDLEPGDVLYMPPHFFHRVTSLPSPSDNSPSFSINSWWSSSSFRRMAKVLAQPLPFEADWSDRQRAFAAREYIRALYAEIEAHLRKVAPATTPASSSPFLARELLATRFYPLFSSMHNPPLDAQWCANMQRSLSLESASGAPGAGLTACAGLTSQELQAMLPESARASAAASQLERNVADLEGLLRSHLRASVRSKPMRLYSRVDPEMARLHVQNVVEEVSWYAVGAHRDLLYPFLACCVDEPQ